MTLLEVAHQGLYQGTAFCTASGGCRATGTKHNAFVVSMYAMHMHMHVSYQQAASCQPSATQGASVAVWLRSMLRL